MANPNKIRYCPNCMRGVSADARRCPHCDFGIAEYRHPDYALPIGSTLHAGRYLTGRTLGQGGFGLTYLGFDQTLRMKVAIKEFYPTNLSSRAVGKTALSWRVSEEEWSKERESFLKEALKMAKINQIPNVVQVKTVFYQNQTAYIVMDFVDGETFYDYLSKNGPVNIGQCLQILEPVINALENSHQRGLIHRDVSPDNIMLQKGNQSVWLLDLGAAKELSPDRALPNVSSTTHLVVKKGFSPPEQYMDSGKIGPWTDVYAMSATIYYSLTGEMVPDAVSRMHHDTLRFPASMPVPVARILKKGLEPQPQNRIRSMKELLGELRGVLPPPNPIVEFLKKRGAAVIPFLIMALLLALGGHWWANRGEQPPALTVSRLGNSNANMLNYGGFARAGNEFLYFIAPDNSLYACAYDKEEERFRLADSVKVYDYGAYVTIGEEYVYFMTTDHESLDICRMNPDGSDITPIYSSVKNDGRVFQGLQYARLSNQGEYLYFLITNAELGTLSSLYRYNLNGKLGTLETVIDGNLYWYNLYRDSIYIFGD